MNWLIIDKELFIRRSTRVSRLTDRAIQACMESHCHTRAVSRLVIFDRRGVFLSIRNGISPCQCGVGVGTSVCVCAERAVARVMALVCYPDMTQDVEEESASSVMMTITPAKRSGLVTCVKANPPMHDESEECK